MTNILTQPMHEIWLDDPTGNRLAQLRMTSGFGYRRALNNSGWFRHNLPDTFDQTLVTLPDGIVEFWRGIEPGNVRFEMAGFINYRKRLSQGGNKTVKIAGPGFMDLLGRRIVAYKAESAQALMTDQTDDMLKEITRDNLGADAVAGRNMTAVGGGFTVQANLTDGPSITKEFAFKNLLQLFNEIADTSKQDGTRLYYDLVPVFTSTGIIGLEFRTYTGRRGADHGMSSSQPLFFGEAWGTLEDPSYEEDYTEEANYAYVGGQGVGAARTIEEVPDTARIEKSIWNRKEIFKDGGNSNDTNVLTAKGKELLNQKRPKFTFSGKIVETEKMRYARDWDIGDIVVMDEFGMQFDCLIEGITVEVDGNGEEEISADYQII